MPVTPDDPRLRRPDGPASLRRVVSHVAEIRMTPDDDAGLATQALFGEDVEVFGARGDFAHIRCRRDGYVGWAKQNDLTAAGHEITHRVSGLRQFAYEQADLKSAVKAQLSLGSRVSVMDADGEYKLCHAAGWVHVRHLEAIGASYCDDPAETAERYLNTPYLWGARSGLGLDCSGLMQQAFEAVGVLIPRDSDMQYQWGGEPIENWKAKGALRRGDMVFWKGHVGMMLDGETLIHANAWHMQVAAEPLDLAIERIKNTYAEPIGARRIDVLSMRGTEPEWLGPA